MKILHVKINKVKVINNKKFTISLKCVFVLRRQTALGEEFHPKIMRCCAKENN